jgi:Flp pilus assembly pilin Flp
MRKNCKRKGQAMVEYIIIVVIVAIAVIAVVGVFSDRIRAMFGGATVELGGEQSDVDAAVEEESVEWVKELDKEGKQDGN